MNAQDSPSGPDRRSFLRASALGLAVGATHVVASSLNPAIDSVAAAQAAPSPFPTPAGPTKPGSATNDFNATYRPNEGAAPLTTPPSRWATPTFLHGIASGDPLPDAIVLWTRVTPDPTWTPGSRKGKPTTVRWEICEDPTLATGSGSHSDTAVTPLYFGTPVHSGRMVTDPQRDLTVKVDVHGLRPDTRYLYRFIVEDGPAAGHVSPIGRTRTAPPLNAAVSQIRFALLSCSNWEAGYFSSYRFLAERDDLNFVLHLGDWFYEYATNGYVGKEGLVRPHEWKGETVALANYRRRHAETKTDPDLQRCQARHPFIVTWDDHESANNSSKEGAENHDSETQGSWENRRANSFRAYFEWMPTRVNNLTDGHHLYRRFQFGKLMDLSVLDLRTYRNRENYLKQDDPTHTISGATQMAWLQNNLTSSTCQWKVIGSSVMLAPLHIPPLDPALSRFMEDKAGTPARGITFNADQWDGYQADRAKLLNCIHDHKIKDVVVVAGDVHMSYASNVYVRPDGDMAGPRAAVEFTGPSISASNLDDVMATSVGINLPEQDPVFQEAENAVKAVNQHVRYFDSTRHGYVVVEVKPTGAQADWFYVKDKSQPRTTQHWGMSMMTPSGKSALKRVPHPLKPLR